MRSCMYLCVRVRAPEFFSFHVNLPHPNSLRSKKAFALSMTHYLHTLAFRYADGGPRYCGQIGEVFEHLHSSGHLQAVERLLFRLR